MKHYQRVNIRSTASPCSTHISRRRSLQGSRERCTAGDVGWPRTPPRPLSTSWWPSSCPSHSCSHRSEPAAGRHRTGICLCKRKKAQEFNVLNQITVMNVKMQNWSMTKRANTHILKLTNNQQLSLLINMSIILSISN